MLFLYRLQFGHHSNTQIQMLFSESYVIGTLKKKIILEIIKILKKFISYEKNFNYWGSWAHRF